MIRRQPRSTRTYTLVPYTTLFRSCTGKGAAVIGQKAWAEGNLAVMVRARIRPVAPADQRGEPIEIDPAHESRGRFDELLIDGIDVTRCRPAKQIGRAHV